MKSIVQVPTRRLLRLLRRVLLRRVLMQRALRLLVELLRSVPVLLPVLVEVSLSGSCSLTTICSGSTPPDPQTSLTLDPSQVQPGLALDGQQIPAANQVASATSTNNCEYARSYTESTTDRSLTRSHQLLPHSIGSPSHQRSPGQDGILQQRPPGSHRSAGQHALVQVHRESLPLRVVHQRLTTHFDCSSPRTWTTSLRPQPLPSRWRSRT
jgi:hypothetical protein